VATPASAAAPAEVLAPGQVAQASLIGSTGTTPSDGRLRGPDFTAVVTRVAWPQSAPSPSGSSYVAGTGRRLVAFTLSLTQASADAGVGNAPTGVAAVLKVGANSLPISMSMIDQQIAGGTSGTAQTTGTDSFVASVPARDHDIAVTLSEGGFGQTFDLWTLERSPPSPIVLYRDPSSPTVNGTAAGPFHVSFTNPADGFSSSDDAQVQSATLGYFAASKSSTTPGNPAQAFLVLELQSSYPSVPYGQPNSGHFFSGFSPLPGSQLTFTPSGGSAVPATADSADFSSTNAASDDDGLFDAVYSFAVPATTTGGTLSVLPGTASGTEFTGFTGSGTTVPITITAPATVGLSFPAVPSAPAAQKRPPWVGAPLPATGLAAAPASASGSSSGSSGQSGFPIWVAVVVLLVLAAGAVIFGRYRRAREKVSPAAVVPAPTSQRRDEDVASTAAPAHEAAEGTKGVGAVRPAAAAPITTEVGDASSPVDVPEALNVLGAREVVALEIDNDWALLIELFTYLVFHEHRHLKAAQIAIGLRPSGSRELDEKTVRNAITRLRRCVGVEHLPEATTDGYLIVGILSDWVRFQRLSRQADTTGGEEALALRKEALVLVRGAPFADVNDEWIDAERLRSHMTVAIVKCAERLATDLLEANRPAEAEEAATAGLRGAPRHYVLWELGAWAICDQSDRGRLELWMSDARANLDDEDFARLERSEADHRGPSA
jgi:hypothetical protein